MKRQSSSEGLQAGTETVQDILSRGVTTHRPECFPKYSVPKLPAAEQLHLMQSLHPASAEPRSTCFLSPPSASVFNPHSADRSALGFTLQVLLTCMWPILFFWIENTFGRHPHFQLYNQPVVIPRLYPKAKVNPGKSIKIEKTEIQSPVQVSKKTSIFSVPSIYQFFFQP